MLSRNWARTTSCAGLLYPWNGLDEHRLNYPAITPGGQPLQTDPKAEAHRAGLGELILFSSRHTTDSKEISEYSPKFYTYIYKSI